MQFIKIWSTIGGHSTLNTKKLHQTAFAMLRNAQQVMPHTNWFRAVLQKLRAKQCAQAETEVYQLRMLHTMKAQQFAWAGSVIKGLFRGHAARARLSGRQREQRNAASLPKAKGVQRYRALAQLRKPTAAEVVKNWSSTLRGTAKRVIPSTDSMDGNRQKPAAARVSEWVLGSDAASSFQQCVDNNCTDRTQPGEQDKPIKCYSDSDSSRTTLTLQTHGCTDF